MSEAESKPAAPVVRALSAAEVAARTGWSKREVLAWPGRGCPHDMTTRRQQPSPNFNLDEVLGWRAKIGADVYKPGSDQDPKRQPMLADAAKTPPTPSTPPLPSRARSDGASVDDLGDRVQQLRIKLEDLCVQDTSRMDPAASQKFAAALKPLSSELRELEKHEMEMASKRGELIERRTAARILGDLATVFIAALEGLAIDVPDAVWTAVSQVPAALKEREEFSRVSVIAVGEAVGKARVALADGLSRVAGELDAGPKEPASPGNATLLSEAA